MNGASPCQYPTDRHPNKYQFDGKNTSLTKSKYQFDEIEIPV